VKELGTFGAICTFGAALEGETVLGLEKAAATSDARAISDLLNDMAQTHRKRQRQLERIRRENVTEMILEPISGFYEEEWQLDPGMTAEKTAALEEKLQRFYLAAAVKVSIPQVARQFTKLAEENAAMVQQVISVIAGQHE
jgi:hypothetical protein